MSNQNLRYLHPEAAYALIFALIIFFLFRFLLHYRREQISHFAPKHVLESLLISRSFFIFFITMLCICLAWICLTLALMQPISYGRYPAELAQKRPEAAPQEQTLIKRAPENVIFLLDASASMTAKDEGKSLTRFEIAKEIIDSTISKLSGENVSLHTFTSETTQLSPLTLDYLFLRLMLRQAQINEGGAAGTDLGNAFTAMQNDYFATPDSVLKYLVVLTDGEDTHLEALSPPDRKGAEEKILSVFKEAEKHRLRVITVGIGSKQGAVVPGIQYEGKSVVSILNEPLLKQISQVGRGDYFNAEEFTPTDIANKLTALLQQENKGKEEKVKSEKSAEDENFLIHDLYYQFPLGIAILLLSFAMVLPETSKKVVSRNS